MPRKLVKLSIKETSGVDHPAHLTEGWVVMKSASQSDVTSVLDELRPDETEAPADEVAAEEVVVEELANPVSKEETMSTAGETTPEVVIIPEAASEADILKAMPASIKKMLDESKATAEAALIKAAASEAALIAERDARADEAAVLKASAWSSLNIDPTVVGPALRRLAETDTALANEVVKALDSANAMVETNVVFTEIGSEAQTASDDAYSKMESLAKAAVAEGTAASYEAAILAVAQSNPDLYAAYLSEKGR